MAKLSTINCLRYFQAGVLVWLLATLGAQAAAFRVVTWNLQPNALAGTNGYSKKFQRDLVEEAAETLKKLQPDVVLLQEVSGWDECHRLANALKPAIYNVALVSSFRDPATKQLQTQQVAILSKAKPYLSWAEAWSGEQAPSATGGFAFAAIRVEGKNIGLFSTQLGDEFLPGGTDADTVSRAHMREESARQLVQQIVTLQGWKMNRVQSFLVGGDFNTSQADTAFAQEKTLTQLSDLGFENALGEIPANKRVTLPGNDRRPQTAVDYILALGAKPGRTQILQTALPDHCAVVSDIDLDAAPVVVAAPTPTKSTAATVNGQTANLPAKTTTVVGYRTKLIWTIAITGAVVVILFCLALMMRLRRPSVSKALMVRPTEIDLNTSTPTGFASLSDAERAGVTAGLSRWLKEKFVRKLISDRAQLMATQQIAALKMLAVDERLAKIEKQIQERNHEYEQRIADLLAELETAREENRELIQAKIDLVKAEMEKQGLKTGRFFKPNQQN